MTPETHTIALRTKTPVHIGSGETLAALGYFVHGDQLYVIDQDAFFERLSDVEREQYLDWVYDAIDKRGDGPRLNEFVRNHLRPDDYESFAQSVSAYAVDTSDRPDPARGYWQHLRQPGRGPYFPGSSIKGALRTAIMETVLDREEGAFKRLLGRLRTLNPDNRRGLRRRQSEAWRETEADIFRGGPTNKWAMNNDFMRFVSVSDTGSFDEQSALVVRTDSKGTSRKTAWNETVDERFETRFSVTLRPEAPLHELGLPKHLRDYLSLDALFEALYERTRLHLDKEAYFMGSQGAEAISDTLYGLESENTPDTPLLRLGGGQGFRSTTAMEIVHENAPDIYEKYVATGMENRRKSTNIIPERFPKTRRFIPRQTSPTERFRIDASVLGWVQLERV
jgi:CRISPR type III-A-associated RAMP protein Csm5